MKYKNTIENFIGIFPNVFTSEYCNKVIKFFNTHKKSPAYTTRQEHDNARSSAKEGAMYFFVNETDEQLLVINESIQVEFDTIVRKHYMEYKQKYGFIDDVAEQSQMRMSVCIKLQEYGLSQGYHAWHCDNAHVGSSRRMLVVMAYLNTVESGGETEFLYQSTRVQPVQGTLLIFPAYFTHAHRGNPTLKGNKYIITSWLEYMQ